MPTINVPGIGDVFADGFAEEQTLQRILTALSSADNANSAEAQRNLAQSATTATAGILGLGKQTKDAGEKTKTASQDVSSGFKLASVAGSNFGRQMNIAGRNLVRSFSSVAQQPFALAASLTETITELGRSNRVIGGLIGSAVGPVIADLFGQEGVVGKLFAGTFGAALGAAAPGALSAIAGAIGGFLFQKLNDVSSAFTQVQQAGGLFGGSLIDFRNNANLAGLTMSEFTNVIKNNSEAFSSFGGQTNRGAREFARANQRLVELEARSLIPLGVSFQDMGMATADLMQKFANAGVPIEAIGVGTREFAAATANQIRQQKMMSAIMGRSIEQQKEQERAQRKDAQVQAAIRRLGPQQQAEIERLITAFPQMRDVILDTVTFGDTVSKGALLAESAMPTMADAFKKGARDIIAGNTGAFESLSALAQNSNQIQGELNNLGDITATLGRFTNNELVKIMETSFIDFRKLAVGAMNKTGRDIVTDMAQVGSESNKATNALIALQVENRKLAINLSNLTTEFLKNSDGVVKFLGGATKMLNDGIAGLKSMADMNQVTNVGGFNQEVTELENLSNIVSNTANNTAGNNAAANATLGNNTGTATTPNTNITVNAPTMQNQLEQIAKILRSNNTLQSQLNQNLT